LREHRSSPQDPRAGSLPLGGLIELTLMHTGAQLRDLVGRGAELGRDGQRELEGLRHRAVRAKEVERTGRAQRSSVEQRGQAVDAGPVVSALDEVIGDWIGKDPALSDQHAALDLRLVARLARPRRQDRRRVMLRPILARALDRRLEATCGYGLTWVATPISTVAQPGHAVDERDIDRRARFAITSPRAR
jgi:hypothetical protein